MSSNYCLGCFILSYMFYLWDFILFWITNLIRTHLLMTNYFVTKILCFHHLLLLFRSIYFINALTINLLFYILLYLTE